MEAVGSYMGRPMAVIGLACELSVSQSGWWANTLGALPRPPATLSAHLDMSIRQLKSIVYLSDVDEETGPTSCYPGLLEELLISPLQELVGRVVCEAGSREDSPLHGYYKKPYHQSVASENFRRHFMKLPQGIRFNSHLGWDILPESNLEKAMLAKEVRMVARTGAFIVFDGSSLFHRGGLVRRGERIALQVVFGDA